MPSQSSPPYLARKKTYCEMLNVSFFVLLLPYQIYLTINLTLTNMAYRRSKPRPRKFNAVKWEPSTCRGVQDFCSLRYPHKVTGDIASGKYAATWKKRLAAFFEQEVDLSHLTGFRDYYPGGCCIDFQFNVDGIKYRIYQQGEGSRSALYIVQRYKLKK